MNKRRYKGFDYEARNPAPPEEPEVKAPIRRRAAEREEEHDGRSRQAQEGQEDEER